MEITNELLIKRVEERYRQGKEELEEEIRAGLDDVGWDWDDEEISFEIEQQMKVRTLNIDYPELTTKQIIEHMKIGDDIGQEQLEAERLLAEFELEQDNADTK